MKKNNNYETYFVDIALPPPFLPAKNTQNRQPSFPFFLPFFYRVAGRGFAYVS
jgi:hypothetical protein